MQWLFSARSRPCSKIRLVDGRVIFATVMLAIASCIASAHADQWPEAVKSNYLISCITIHKVRWVGLSKAVVNDVCTCKLNKLQVDTSWEQFAAANKELGSDGLEMYVALPQRVAVSVLKEVLKDMKPSVGVVMLRAVRAEEECAPQ